MIQIDDIQFNEEYYYLLIQLLMNSTGLNLDHYRTNFIEKRIKSRMLRANCICISETLLNSQSDLKIIDPSNRIYLKNGDFIN